MYVHASLPIVCKRSLTGLEFFLKKERMCCNFMCYCTLAPLKAGGGINTKYFFSEIKKIFTNKYIYIGSARRTVRPMKIHKTNPLEL